MHRAHGHIGIEWICMYFLTVDRSKRTSSKEDKKLLFTRTIVTCLAFFHKTNLISFSKKKNTKNRK